MTVFLRVNRIVLSGLSINHSKSQCFLANIPQPLADSILSSLIIPQGVLPVRFLGVPLITTKLTASDCIPLIQRITLRIRSWANCFLSYAGRIQLIKSILFAIQAYWSAYFLLPSAVTKQIDQLLSRFLWKGSSLDIHGAKIAWARVTLPVTEGGLGLKKVAEWNKAQILLYLWRVISYDSSSYWAEWVRKTLLLKHNFWTTPIPSNASWIWRKVLNLRSLAAPFIAYIVGNGQRIDLWQDPWLEAQPLAWHRSDPIVSNSGLPFSAKVSAIIEGCSWALPVSNYSSIRHMKDLILQIPLPTAGLDRILWDGLHKVKVSNIWNSIRQQGSAISWSKLVWHPLHIPRFAFFLWLALHKRLVTWPHPWCVLCDQPHESFSHLFFDCTYSGLLLRSVLAFQGWFGVPFDWDQLIQHIQHTRMDPMPSHILKLCLATIVYKIWNERNRRIHGESPIPAAALAQDCIKIVKCRLFSVKNFSKAIDKCPSLRIWLL